MSEGDMIGQRVAQSSLITLNLEAYFPTEPIVHFDLQDYLFQGFDPKEGLS